MLENDTIETASTEVSSIRRRNDIEKSMPGTQQYFVNFESRIRVEISMSNRSHNFHVDSPFKLDVISTWNLDVEFGMILWIVVLHSFKYC